MQYINIYNKLIANGVTKQLPYIKIRERQTDKPHTWNKETDRMDNLSQRYYNTPHGAVFIKMANAKYGDEFDIPDRAFIRIPYPLPSVIQEFNDELNKYDAKYGL
jgi:hypothetical protein